MTAAPEVVVDLRGEGIGAASDRIVQVATALGYSVVAVGPGSFRIARSRRPTWAIVMAVLFGICAVGLLFLLVKRTEDAVITVFEDRTGTKARVVGAIDPRLSAQLVASGGASPSAAGASAPLSSVVSPPPPVASHVVVPEPVTSLPSAPVPATPDVPQAVTAHSFAPPASTNDDFGATVVRPLRASVAARSAVRLPNGVVVAVAQRVVIGRNPDGSRHPGAELVVLADPSLSKTHVLIEPSPDGVTVTDLHSTNGTSVIRDGVVVACTPDQPRGATVGSVIRLGDADVRVEGLG